MNDKASTRRRWTLAQPSFPEALARVRRDGLVIETFLPEQMGSVPKSERWDGRTLTEVLGAELAAPWLERIGAALDQGGISTELFKWARADSSLSFEARIVPLGNDEVLAIAREVGYQERLEADRDTLRTLLERVTDLLPDVVYVFDHANDCILFQNRAITEVLGYSPEQAAALGANPVPRLVHPDDLTMFPEVLARTMAASDDEELSYEGRWRAADGAWRWYVTHSRIFKRGPDGTPMQVFGVMRDVTEQRALEQRVHRAAKLDALGTVAGSIAHDFNNALTAIRGFAELLEGEVSAAGKADLAELRSAIDGAKGLSSRVLSFSRTEHRRLEPLELAALVRKVAPMLARMLGTGIRLELDLPPEPAVVRADPQELEQVLVNLALNARDAMPKGGALRISVDSDAPRPGASFSEEGGRWVRLAMTDTGEGMSPEVHDRAFEPFFTTKATGTGLGLASAKLAIEYAGGTLQVSSRQGIGTTFVVRLPWCATPPRASAPAAVAAPTRGRGVVLAVDDEPMVLRLIDATLRRAGYRVLTAAGHHDALRIAADAAVTIDLLVSDVVMPEMSGPELASHVRALRPGLPVLFVSGFHDEAQIPLGGADTTLLRKPFSPRQLSETAARMLSEAPSPDRSRP